MIDFSFLPTIKASKLSNGTSTRRHEACIPWNIPLFTRLNGFHPLVASFLEHLSQFDIELLEETPQKIDGILLDSVVARLARKIRGLEDAQIDLLLPWLNLSSQLFMESRKKRDGFVFMHTTPLYIGSRPWILHFESFLTLFMPFMRHGTSRGIELTQQSYFETCREWLRSKNCKAVFSHMKASLLIAEEVFQDPEITRKLHYVPLGISTRPDAFCLKSFDRTGPLRILFTNSLHQDPSSFYFRGGHHLLKAFAKLRRTNENIELTIVSSIPPDFGTRFHSDDLDGVIWIKDRIEDAVLERLLDEAHIFALPAAGLHSFSFLRALAHGCVPMVSDAPGYDEWVSGIEESVLTIYGVSDLIYRREKAGWISDEYAPFLIEAPIFEDQICAAIQSSLDLARLKELAKKNLEHCRSNLTVARSRSAMHKMFEKWPAAT